MSLPALSVNGTIVLAVVATSRRPVRVPPCDGAELLGAGYAAWVGARVCATGLGVRWWCGGCPQMRALQQAAGRRYLTAWQDGREWDGTYPDPGLLRLT